MRSDYWAGTPPGWGQATVKQMMFGLPPIADLTCGLVGRGIDFLRNLLAAVSARSCHLLAVVSARARRRSPKPRLQATRLQTLACPRMIYPTSSSIGTLERALAIHRGMIFSRLLHPLRSELLGRNIGDLDLMTGPWRLDVVNDRRVERLPVQSGTDLCKHFPHEARSPKRLLRRRSVAISLTSGHSYPSTGSRLGSRFPRPPG